MTTATARYATTPLTLTGGEKLIADKADTTATGGTTTQDIANLYKGTAGASIASAATVNLANATGNVVHITGSTGPITSLGTVAAGREIVLVFDSTPTLTHNATSLILPTGANIVAAAGDSARMFSEGSGNWRCLSYSRATGTSVGGASISDGDKGDITTSSSGTVWTIDNDVVTNAKAANMAVNTFKGRITSGTGDPEDLTPAQARKILRPVNALSISSGVVNIDCSLGVDFTLSLTANVTSITFSNLQGSGFVTEIEVQITQDATGSRTVALPAAFKALGGSDTAVNATASSTTVLSAKTWDNGSTWRYAMQESA